MNFSKKNKLVKLLSLITVLILMTSLFTGCKKDDVIPETTEGELNLNINLEPETPTETTEAPTEPIETAPPVNEKSATVTSQLNVRSLPTTQNGDKGILGTLYAGDKVIVERREESSGIQWAYISSPMAGWICMDFVEMDVPDAQTDSNSTPAGSNPENQNNNSSEPAQQQPSTTAVKGVVTTGLNIRKEASTTSAIVGSYSKGDVITILESTNGWGRTSKGWIKMQYVNVTGNTTGSTNNTSTNTNTSSTSSGNTVSVSGNGNKTVQFKGVVKVKDLNIRSSASTSGTRVGSYTLGNRVEFLEKDGNWGRTEKGWICLDYVYQDGTTGSKTATGTVTGNGLNIRSGPGTGYAAVGSLSQGDRVSILEQFTYGNTTWGCIKNGWICMDYVDVDGDTSSNTTNNTYNDNSSGSGTSMAATIIGNGVNIRSGPGTNYGTVGTLNNGDKITITAQQSGDGRTWGKMVLGWVCMDYLTID